MKGLIIVRGIPGSGKSTYAKSLVEKGFASRHIESDQFFMKKGEYCFDASKLKEAHQWCRDEVKKALDNNETVVVSNTFTRLWEFQPYIDMVDSDDYAVVRMVNEFSNIHNVPENVVENMKDRFEDFKGEVNIKMGEEL